MHLLRTPSVIRRVLMQRLESREAKKEIVPDGENIEVTNSEQEAVHGIRELGANPALENDESVLTGLREDPSRLLLPNIAHKEDVFGDEETSSYFLDDMTHFGKQGATFFSDFSHELLSVDPFDCFIEQVVTSLTTVSLREGEGYFDLAIELQLSPPPDLNHYHQYVDQSSFNEGSQFSELSTSIGNQNVAEIQQGTSVIQIEGDLGTHDFGTVEGILGGERLSTGDDDLINFYDGEPIEIGVPVVLEPVEKLSEPIVENGGPSLRNRSGGESGDQGNSLRASLSEFDDITMDLLDCSRGDVSFTVHADKSWAGKVLILEKFELGADSLRMESLLETETMETLLDNRPMERVGADGEHSLCFSIAADSGAGYTISFLGLSLDQYMEFLSSTMKDMTVA